MPSIQVSFLYAGLIYTYEHGGCVRVRKHRCQECGSYNTSVSRETNSVTYSCLDCGTSIIRRRVKQCPTCGSSDLYFEAGLITGQKYHCKKCDYIGPLVFEKEIEEKIRK